MNYILLVDKTTTVVLYYNTLCHLSVPVNAIYILYDCPEFDGYNYLFKKIVMLQISLVKKSFHALKMIDNQFEYPECVKKSSLPIGEFWLVLAGLVPII